VTLHRKQGLAGVLGIVVALCVTGAVVRSKSDAAQRGGLFQHVPIVASTGGGITPPAGASSDGQPSKAASAEDDARIAMIVARLMGDQHYSRRPMDDALSSRLLDRYLDALDPQHLYFYQSDVQAFEKYRNQLDDLILKGDTTPAQEIFDVFKQRMEEQVAFVQDALKTEKFEFNGDDTYTVDRKKIPRPASEDEAKTLWRSRLRYEYLDRKLAKEKPEEIVKTLGRRYSRLERAFTKEFDSDDVLELYLTTLTHVYDPHSDYFGKATTENFGIQMKLSLFGVGAQLQSEDGYTKIVELTPGGPALKSGKLHPGDRIVAVAQGLDGEPVDVVDMKIDRVVEMIRGPKGTTVRLTIIPADAPDTSTRKTVTLLRDEIKLEEQAAKAQLVELPGPGAAKTRVGIIDLPSFYQDPDKGKSATEDVKALLTKLKAEGVSGIILDLRRNGGGSLQEAISLTGLFIKEGPVVQVRDPSGRVQVDSDEDPGVAYDGPLVVLTSRLSASASEIVAGALQDYGRALLVGDASTFGKGTVQAVISLGPIMQRLGRTTAQDPGSLKLTVQKFYRASGSSTQLRGVVPDITLPSLTDSLDIAEKSLDNPLPWDEIKSAEYRKENRVQPFVAQLKSRSATRLAADKDFGYLRQQIAQTKKMVDQKAVSLNEQKRSAERNEAEARQKARQKELALRSPDVIKIYPLTLRDATRPGLPAPVTAKQLADATQQRTAARARVDDASTDGEDDTSSKYPERDILMDETERILLDYIALARK
jgi:carboxyl-terminal processing protease